MIAGPFSLYIDAMRVAAAGVVFVGHLCQAGYMSAIFPTNEFGAHQAVVVFFVLSGVVITATAPGDIRSYAIARAARMLSVIVPALVLGFVTKAMTEGVSPVDVRDVALSLLFLGQSWGLSIFPPQNEPYWSINYEVWYYAVFGLWLYGYRRAAVAAGVVAGPAIMLLFPIWLAGSWVLRRQVKPNAILGAVLMIVPAIVVVWIAASELDIAIRSWLQSFLPVWRLGASQRFITDYVVAACVLANIIGFKMLPRPVIPCPEAIRFAAGLSFSLYLYHTPLVRLAQHFDLGVWFVLPTIALLGALTEWRARDLRRWMAGETPMILIPGAIRASNASRVPGMIRATFMLAGSALLIAAVIEAVLPT